MDRITRKELKGDAFAQEVGQTVTLFEQHKKEIVRYGAIVLGVAVLAAGYFFYSGRQHDIRQAALYQAILAQEAPVGATATPGGLSFPTQEAKDAETLKRFGEVKSKYSGTAEGYIAEYYTASILADEGKLKEAEASYQSVADRAGKDYSSLAKYALSQLYFADGRLDQAEKILKDLQASPTVFVSADQATIGLARVTGKRNPAEARKMLQGLASKPGALGQLAITMMGEIQ